MSEDKYITDQSDELEAIKDGINDNGISPDIEESENVIPASVDTAASDMALNNSDAAKKKFHFDVIKALRILFSAGFVIFAALFVNEAIIQPYVIRQSLNKMAELKPVTDITVTPTTAPVVTQKPASTENTADDKNQTTKADQTQAKASDRDEVGRLVQFRPLIEINHDVKGWITIPDSNMDLVVMQSTPEEGPEYYLTRDLYGKKLKAGSLFLDYKSSVEKNTQALVIYGHNMTSTDNMFHYLIKYKELDYYKQRPVFTFNSIYNTGKWKIFSVFLSNGDSTKEPLFDFTRATFKDSSDFLNYIYQLRIRSMYNIDDVDINENDQILVLSTCSYEVKNYRTVVVARKVRDGEAPTVNVDSVTINEAPLYPGSWYYRFGGKPPKLAATFEEALANGDIKWYKPVNEDNQISQN